MPDGPEPSPLFDQAFLDKLEYLRLVSRHVLPGRSKGEHRARKRGSGLEFADHRPYGAGDDTRQLDWRAYLRLERLLLRLHEEEADLPIHLLVDASASMAGGTPPKFDHARRVAAALGYVGLVNLDRVRFAAFARGLGRQLPPRRGRNQVWSALRFLEELEPGGGTALAETFSSAFGGRRRRGLVVVISDFLDPKGAESALDELRYLGHDVFAVHVVAPAEERPALDGDTVMVDAEDGSEVRISAAQLAAYQAELTAHCEGIDGYCRRHGWGYVRALSDEPFEDLVLQIFRQDRLLR